MAADTIPFGDAVGQDLRRSYADAATFYRGNLDAMVASNRAMIDGVQAVNSEVLAFCQSQMKEALDTGRRIAASQSADAAWAAQVEFVQNAMRAWSDEVRKLADIGGKVFGESVSPLTARAEKVDKMAA